MDTTGIKSGHTKVGVVGVGAVGAATSLALIERGVCRELILIDRNAARARGVALDMSYGAPLSPTVDVQVGDYDALAGAQLVILTAGLNEKTGGATNRSDPEGRLRLLEANAEIYREIVPRVVKVAPRAVLMVVTDPPDPLADLTRMLAGHDRVFSTGTLLDSLRFRVHLAERLGVRPRDVDALVVGEHGVTEVLLWSSARMAGIPVLQLLESGDQPAEKVRAEVEDGIRFANINIIEGTGASQYGIGMACSRIVDMVLRDERAVIPIGSYNPTYGVTLSVPSVIGRSGVVQIVEPDLVEDERRALQRSADTLRHAMERVQDSGARLLGH